MPLSVPMVRNWVTLGVHSKKLHPLPPHLCTWASRLFRLPRQLMITSKNPILPSTKSKTILPQNHVYRIVDVSASPKHTVKAGFSENPRQCWIRSTCDYHLSQCAGEPLHHCLWRWSKYYAQTNSYDTRQNPMHHHESFVITFFNGTKVFVVVMVLVMTIMVVWWRRRRRRRRKNFI